MAIYPNTVERTLSDYLGEHLSVLSFGAKGDGVTDDAPAFNTAISTLRGLGGRTLYLPGGRNYLLKSHVVLPSGEVRLRFLGDGDSSVVRRHPTTDMPNNRGAFDIDGSRNVTFENFRFDGGVTTAVAKNYNTIATPMDVDLTRNSGFWLHGGSAKIAFKGVTFTHAGGYAVLADATALDVDDISILDCLFENNRPFLFGVVPGDIRYGSWAGGVHLQGDGAAAAVRNFLLRGSTFRRNTGHGFWSHAYGLGRAHSNIRVVDNHFQDMGLDAVQLGVVTGGVVQGNTFRRIGYICETDSDTPQPRWGEVVPVALDTAGRVRGVNYRGNTFISVNGGCMDLDGYGQGVVSGNMCFLPRPTDPEYAEDSIANCWPKNNPGENWMYGVQTSNNNNDTIAGRGVNVTGNTFINMGGGAVKLYAGRQCLVIGNNIDHYPDAKQPPIILGNIGVGNEQRSYENIVTENRISWSPNIQSGAIFEDSQSGAFQPTDVNWVANNRIVGSNVYEFRKNPNTSSVTKQVFTSAEPNQDRESSTTFQREGGHTAAYMRMLSTVMGVKKASWTLTDSGTFHVGIQGALGTGAISTGDRTTIGMMDSVNTGKLLADGFIIIGDRTFTIQDSDLFNTDFGLIRYEKTSGKFYQSTSFGGDGHRIWSPLGGVAGLDKQVQFNSAGVLYASPNLTWDNGLQQLTISGIAGTLGLVINNGYAQSAQGFYTPFNQGNAFNAPNGGLTAQTAVLNSTAGNALHVPNGGIEALQLTATVGLYLFNRPSTPTAITAAGWGGWQWKGGSVYWYWNGSAWAQIDLSAIGGSNALFPNNIPLQWQNTSGVYREVLKLANDNNVYLDNTLQADIYLRPASSRFVWIGQGGVTPAYLVPNGTLVDLGTTSYRWNIVYCGSVNSSTVAYNAIQAIGTGGVGADWGGFFGYSFAVRGRNSNPPLSSGSFGGQAGTAKFFADWNGYLYVSQAGGQFERLVTGNPVPANLSITSLTATGNAYNSIQATGTGGVYAYSLQAGAGTYNALQAPSGGCMTGMGYWVGGVQVINNQGHFVGGVVTSSGISAAGFNPTGYTGQTYAVRFPVSFTINGTPFNTMNFRGGVLTSVANT